MIERIKSYLKDRLKKLEDLKNERRWVTSELDGEERWWTTAELGDMVCCKQTLEFIDSLQEEPLSEDLEDAAYNWVMDNYGNPKFSSFEFEQRCFRAGAKWQKEQMMKDATEVTVHIDAGGYPYAPEIELYDYDKDIPLAKEGDKYKVVLIKEE